MTGGSPRHASLFSGSVVVLLIVMLFIIIARARFVLAAGLRNTGAVLVIRDSHLAFVTSNETGANPGKNTPAALMKPGEAFYRLSAVVRQPSEWPPSGLSLTYLLAEDPESAIEIMQKRAQSDPTDILNHLRLAEAYDARGQLVEALSAYEQVLGRLENLPETGARIQSQARVRQRIANDQFYLGRSYAQAADFARAVGYLRAALKERHNDAFATYYLLVSYSELGQDENTVATRQALQQVRFDWEDDLGEQCNIIADLLNRQVWNRDLALRMLALLVWKCAENPIAERIVSDLSSRHSDDARWIFYLAELYQRRGDNVKAERLYHEALPAERTYSEAAMRLNDLLGHQPAPQVDVNLVSELLGVSSGQIRIGSDKIGNVSGISKGTESNLSGWKWDSYANAWVFGPGAFIGGLDAVITKSGYPSIRIDGLWTDSRIGFEAARAGFQLVDFDRVTARQVLLPARSGYLLIFNYKTQYDMDPKPEFWLSPDLTIENAQFLPTTNGEWRLFLGLVWNPGPDQRPISLLLRNWGMGVIWFDNVQLREVALPPEWQPPLQRYIIR